jgi:hypothetical protein
MIANKFRVDSMMKVRQEILAACLSALLLSGCAPPGPIPSKLVGSDAPGESRADADTDTHHANGSHHTKGQKKGPPLSARLEYETAVKECGDLATKETMGSILTIVTRLRPGAYTASYVACMKAKGYAVRQ